MPDHLSRRQLLQRAGALDAFTVVVRNPALAELFHAPHLVPWRNWPGAQSCLPLTRKAPKDLGELVQIIRQTSGRIRPVGSGHSFSALVPTDGTLPSLAYFNGLLSHDGTTLQTEFGGGTPMSQIDTPLREIDQMLVNMAGIDYQTPAGAVVTSTRGTGVGSGSCSAQIRGLQLVTANGEVLECDAKRNVEVFNAARVSLGALDVAIRVRLQNRAAYRLRERQQITRTEGLLEDVEKNTRENQHWEMLVVIHSDHALSIALNETDGPKAPPLDPAKESNNKFIDLIEGLDKYLSDFPETRRTLLDSLRHFACFDKWAGDSYAVYADVHNAHFNGMKYSVPAEHGPVCLQEILALIRDRDLRTWFPVEYRYMKAGDVPLSMSKDRDSCSISVYQHYSMDHHNFFAAVEPIFWKYTGHPHWSKLHGLSTHQLQGLYPRWRAFTEVRQVLGPRGRFLNAHLSSTPSVT